MLGYTPSQEVDESIKNKILTTENKSNSLWYNQDLELQPEYKNFLIDLNFRQNKVDFTKCTFKDCDLSNKSFDEGYFSKVKFLNCKMTGTSFTDSFIENTDFIDCLMIYTNFSGAKLKQVNYKTCDLSESSFIESKFNKVSFEESKLIKSEFTNTSLKNIDFSTCNIDGIRIDLYSVKGLTIDSMQAYNLIYMLGVNIK